VNLLALDTSSDACSVALLLGEDVVDDHLVEAKQHTSILIPMIRKLLAEAETDFAELDAIVLGNGPGSFIGMRIAASVAQGLAFASGVKILPVSSMAVVAAEVMSSHQADDVIVAQDARMNEVYLGIYRRDQDGLPVPIADERLQPIGRIEIDAAPLVACGDGFRKYPALYELNRARISKLLDIRRPKARFLLDLGARMWQAHGAIEPDKLVPAYIRERVATPPTTPET
jgi:tRNA threonylcarbamoyladenosine biosynthesis protein TsaB